MIARILVCVVAAGAILLLSLGVATADVEATMTQARAAMETKDYATAARLYHDVVTQYPNDTCAPEAVMGLGRCYRFLRQGDYAVQTFGYLLSTYPQSQYASEAKYQIACCYLEKDDVKQSIKELSEFVGLYPQSRHAPEAQLQVGYMHLRLAAPDQSKDEQAKHNSDADAAFAKVISMFPLERETCAKAEIQRANIALLESRKQPETLQKLKDRVISLQQQYSDMSTEVQNGFKRLLTQIASAKGDSANAVEGADDLLRSSGGTPEARRGALLLKASVYFKQAEYAQALEQYLAVIDECKKGRSDLRTLEVECSAQMLSARCYVKLGQIDKAKEIWQSVVKNHPKSYYATLAKQRLAECSKSSARGKTVPAH